MADLVAIDEKLGGTPEDDPQRGELGKERLGAMLQFNAAVLKQNASNLIAMPASKLSNEHALAQASDASQLKNCAAKSKPIIRCWSRFRKSKQRTLPHCATYERCAWCVRFKAVIMSF